MRKIEFKGKSKNGNFWVTGQYVKDFNKSKIKHFIYVPGNDTPFTEVYKKSVAQYIGRKDIHGKKIYEHMKVKVSIPHLNFTDIGIVKFKDCSFCISNKIATYYAWMDYNIEIIK